MSTRTTQIRNTVTSTVKDQVDFDVNAAQASGTTTAPTGTSENPSNRVLTVANAITACRLVLTLVFLYLFVNDLNRYVALSCYAVAALTDFLDGQVARRTQTVSWVGKVMDPIMDRVLLFTGVLGLMITGELPVWVAAFVIGRDAYLAVGSMILQRYRHRPVDVVYIGKVTTALLMAGFCDLLLGLPVIGGLDVVGVDWLPGLNAQGAAAGIFLVYAGLACSAVTAVIYTMAGFEIRRRAMRGDATASDGQMAEKG